MDDQTRDIPLECLVEPRTILRLVDRGSIEYMELVESVRADKILNSILVRPAKEPGRYEIIDGLTRYTAAKEVGLTSMPCIIKFGKTDEECLSLQFQANAISLETTPAEYAERLKRIFTINPEMTLADMAAVVKKSPTWIGQHLKLLSLPRSMRLAVDRGEIPLENGYMLAKLPSRFQRDFLDQARTLPVREFRPIAASVIKQYKEAVRDGKLEAFWTAEFKPTAHLRKLKVVQHEYDHRAVGPLLIAADNCKTPLDGFYLALRWALHLDRDSLAEQEARARKRLNQHSVTDVTGNDLDD